MVPVILTLGADSNHQQRGSLLHLSEKFVTGHSGSATAILRNIARLSVINKTMSIFVSFHSSARPGPLSPIAVFLDHVLSFTGPDGHLLVGRIFQNLHRCRVGYSKAVVFFQDMHSELLSGRSTHYIRLNIFLIPSIENRTTVGLPWGQV